MMKLQFTMLAAVFKYCILSVIYPSSNKQPPEEAQSPGRVLRINLLKGAVSPLLNLLSWCSTKIKHRRHIPTDGEKQPYFSLNNLALSFQ